VAGKALVIAVVLVAARPLAVAVCLPWFKFTKAEMLMISWSGLRGAVPIVLATFPLTAGHPDGTLIFDVVFFVVLLSAAVQGSTVAWVSRRLGLRADPDDVAVLSEIVPMETLDADVVRLVLGSSSSVVGQQLRAVPLPGEARVAVVVRQGRSFVPDGHTILEAGDVVMVTVPEGHSAEPLQVWAAPRPARGNTPGTMRPG
jgi:cell volume regulation protein A